MDGVSEGGDNAATEFALGVLEQMPKGSPAEVEAHLTAVLILFWGALWGTMGTAFARSFIKAQLSGMDQEHTVFTRRKPS